MVQCELCGRQFKNTQGLRGHKTFFHGHHIKHNKPVKIGESGFDKSNNELERLSKDIKDVTEMLVDLQGNLHRLENRIESLVPNSAICRIVSEIDRLNKQVKKHDHWFNPRGVHEAIVDLDGGPIAFLEKRLRNRQSFNK